MLMQMHTRRVKGFTLIEILMTVAIIGILAAIALPNYQNSVRKSKREVAISDMLLYKQAEEKYRTNNLTYGDTPVFTAQSGPNAQYYVKTSSSSSDYTFTITGSATGYTISAFPQGNQAHGYETSCAPLTLTEADARGPSDACWAR